jgi:hypothetical protein
MAVCIILLAIASIANTVAIVFFHLASRVRIERLEWIIKDYQP